MTYQGQYDRLKTNKRRVLNKNLDTYEDRAECTITTKMRISVGAFNSHFRTWEDVLCELIVFVLERQFSVSEKLLAGKTDDKLLLYAVEAFLKMAFRLYDVPPEKIQKAIDFVKHHHACEVEEEADHELLECGHCACDGGYHAQCPECGEWICVNSSHEWDEDSGEIWCYNSDEEE
ncbi:MAG: hypothetical protein LUD16_04795 [Lachnospiraceae bacterium]|nr:hypothetical protein [Lachnospiraceae bacterium]